MSRPWSLINLESCRTLVESSSTATRKESLRNKPLFEDASERCCQDGELLTCACPPLPDIDTPCLYSGNSSKQASLHCTGSKVSAHNISQGQLEQVAKKTRKIIILTFTLLSRQATHAVVTCFLLVSCFGGGDDFSIPTEHKGAKRGSCTNRARFGPCGRPGRMMVSVSSRMIILLRSSIVVLYHTIEECLCDHHYEFARCRQDSATRLRIDCFGCVSQRSTLDSEGRGRILAGPNAI